MWFGKRRQGAQDVDVDVKVVEVIANDDAQSLSSDDERLMAMGKKPQLKRVYNFWTCEYIAASTRPG